MQATLSPLWSLTYFVNGPLCRSERRFMCCFTAKYIQKIIIFFDGLAIQVKVNTFKKMLYQKTLKLKEIKKSRRNTKKVLQYSLTCIPIYYRYGHYKYSCCPTLLSIFPSFIHQVQVNTRIQPLVSAPIDISTDFNIGQ